jgi:hypothetical protein
MVDEGYDKEVLSSPQTRNKVVAACAAPDSAPIVAKNLRKWKDMVSGEWSFAWGKFFNGSISKYKEPLKPEAVVTKPVKTNTEPEKPLEQLAEEVANSNNRLRPIKIDRGDDTNWELLEELGMDSENEIE